MSTNKCLAPAVAGFSSGICVSSLLDLVQTHFPSCSLSQKFDFNIIKLRHTATDTYSFLNFICPSALEKCFSILSSCTDP